MTKFLRCLLLVTVGIMTACGGGMSSNSSTTSNDSSVTLQSIRVSAANLSITAGTTQQFTATGTYSDHTTKDLTQSVVWSSSDPGVAKIASNGTAKAMAPGSVTITATETTVSGQISVTVAPAILTSITVTSTASSVAAGLTDQFTATGNYSDGSTQDLTNTVAWTVSKSSVAAISGSGLASTRAAGSAVITATKGTISGTSTLTVGSPLLASITVSSASASIAAGLTSQFTAAGTFTDGSSQNLGSSVTWSVSNLSVATISNSGLVSAKTAGSIVVTATQGTMSGTSALTVGPPTLASIAVNAASAAVGVGFTDQFTAIGTYSDGSTQNLSSSVNWSVSNPSLALISGSGLLSAKSNGSAIITATSGSVSGSAPLTITISLVSMAVTPSSQTLAPGTDQQFKAIGTYTDGSTKDITGIVTWSSSDTTKATISSSVPTSGLAQAAHAGSTIIITASLGSISATATLTVTNGKLVSIAVTPATTTIPLGITQQFTAMGTFSDGTTQDITNTVNWSSSEPTYLSITVSGAATGLNLTQNLPPKAAPMAITATSGGVSGSTTSVTVNAADLNSLSIQPGNMTLAEGTNGKLSAIGLFNDGSTRDVSALATWSSSNPSGAPSQGNGRVQAANPGLAGFTATVGSQTASANVNVTNATIVSISVTPSIASIAPGTQLTYAATGQFSDSSTQVISNSVTWASSDNTVAQFKTGAPGIAAGVATGSVTISATFAPAAGGNATGSAQLNVTGANLTGVTITPATAVVAPASTQQYRAIATYDDGTTQNVSLLANWTSSSVNVATVSQFGQITGQSAGISTITASFGGFFSTANVLVDASALTSIAVTPPSSSVPQQILTNLKAIGSFADGSTQDLTGAVIWTSSNSSVATISDAAGSRGQATAIAPGTSTISAVFAGQVGTATMTVTSATLTGINISPNSASIALGSTQPFVATGIFSDGTTANLSTQATWNSTDTNVAVISAQGLATSASAGTTKITATLNGVSATPVVLTVN